MATYQYLEPRQGSYYRQYFVKGRRIRAEVLYRETIGVEPRKPEEVAADFGLPLEAVLEAIAYCQRNQDVVRADWEREESNHRSDRQKGRCLGPADERAAS